MFEELADWEVRAVRAGEQTHPEDAVARLTVLVRAQFGVAMSAWDAARQGECLVDRARMPGRPGKCALSPGQAV